MTRCKFTDNRRARRYELDLGDGAIARIDYRIAGNRITLIHTGVPAPFKGRGIGRRLTEAALADIAARGLEPDPQCTFIARYIERHPDWRERLQPVDTVDLPDRD